MIKVIAFCNISVDDVNHTISRLIKQYLLILEKLHDNYYLVQMMHTKTLEADNQKTYED